MCGPSINAEGNMCQLNLDKVLQQLIEVCQKYILYFVTVMVFVTVSRCIFLFFYPGHFG